MSRLDITMYGREELSLHFLNTEHLYHAMRGCALPRHLREIAEEYFIFTDEQWQELLTDWSDNEEKLCCKCGADVPDPQLEGPERCERCGD